MSLDDLTHDQLDAVAAARNVDPYPSSGTKAAKVAAIRDANPLPSFATAVANASLSGWRSGEIRTVTVDDRLLRRAANGLVTVLSVIEPEFDPSPADPDATPQPLASPEPPPAALYGDDDPAPVPADPDDGNGP